MATLRRDGFTSLEATQSGLSRHYHCHCPLSVSLSARVFSLIAGVAVTKPLVFTGRHLFVNFGVGGGDGDSSAHSAE